MQKRNKHRRNNGRGTHSGESGAQPRADAGDETDDQFGEHGDSSFFFGGSAPAPLPFVFSAASKRLPDGTVKQADKTPEKGRFRRARRF